MQPWLTGFSADFRTRLLELLWRQWTALGIAGQGDPWHGTPLDPEALLLVSCTVARHDARLFDAMLDWLGVNGRYVNVQRLRRMLAERRFAGGAVYAAVAAVASTSTLAVKWARSTEMGMPRCPEPLFHLLDGKPLPVVHAPDPTFHAHGFLRDRYVPRNAAYRFRPDAVANLLLRLRALLGVSARCEILAYLLVNGKGSPRAIARACGYYPATVAKALAEMGDSGYVSSRVIGRQRHCMLVPDTWHSLLCPGGPRRWIVWPCVYRALEEIWTFLHAPELQAQSPLAQASALRRVLRASVAEEIACSGLPVIFGDDRPHTGESLLPFFVTEMDKVLGAVEHHGVGQAAQPVIPIQTRHPSKCAPCSRTFRVRVRHRRSTEQTPSIADY